MIPEPPKALLPPPGAPNAFAPPPDPNKLDGLFCPKVVPPPKTFLLGLAVTCCPKPLMKLGPPENRLPETFPPKRLVLPDPEPNALFCPNNDPEECPKPPPVFPNRPPCSVFPNRPPPDCGDCTKPPGTEGDTEDPNAGAVDGTAPKAGTFSGGLPKEGAGAAVAGTPKAGTAVLVGIDPNACCPVVLDTTPPNGGLEPKPAGAEANMEVAEVWVAGTFETTEADGLPNVNAIVVGAPNIVEVGDVIAATVATGGVVWEIEPPNMLDEFTGGANDDFWPKRDDPVEVVVPNSDPVVVGLPKIG